MSVLQYTIVVGFCVYIYGQIVEETISGPSALGYHFNESFDKFQKIQNRSSFHSNYHNFQYDEEASDQLYKSEYKPNVIGQKNDQFEEETIIGPSAFGFDSYKPAHEITSEHSILNDYHISKYVQKPSLQSEIESNPKLKVTTIEKKVLVPYPITREKKIPYKEEILVDKPYLLPVLNPYPVTVEKKVPFEAKVHIPVPYIVEKKIPYKVEIPVNKPYHVSVSKPYNVYIEKKIPQTEIKYVPFEVKVPIDKPYPVHVPIVKNVPYTVEKRIPVELKVPVDKPYIVEVLKPYKVIVERKVPFILEKHIPYEVKVPVEIPVPVVKHVTIDVPNKQSH